MHSRDDLFRWIVRSTALGRELTLEVERATDALRDMRGRLDDEQAVEPALRGGAG